jgi:hypothetical protein
MLAVAAGLIVQTARPHYRYGAWFDGTATVELAGLLIPFGMGLTMVLLHIAKAMLLAVAAWFWSRAQCAFSLMAVLLFLVLLPVSITSTLPFSIFSAAPARPVRHRPRNAMPTCVPNSPVFKLG